MKTQEQQKAELCDRIIYLLRNSIVSESLNEFVSEYDAITAQKPLTADPYADEVFSGRLITFLTKHLKDYPKQLSECPTIQELVHSNIKGFGRKSREEYIEVMKKYGFNDKI